jgi:hypothetical protein
VRRFAARQPFHTLSTRHNGYSPRPSQSPRFDVYASRLHIPMRVFGVSRIYKRTRMWVISTTPSGLRVPTWCVCARPPAQKGPEEYVWVGGWGGGVMPVRGELRRIFTANRGVQTLSGAAKLAPSYFGIAGDWPDTVDAGHPCRHAGPTSEAIRVRWTRNLESRGESSSNKVWRMVMLAGLAAWGVADPVRPRRLPRTTACIQRSCV